MPLFNIQSTKYRYSTSTDSQLVHNVLDITSVAKVLQFLSARTEASLSLVTSLGIRVFLVSDKVSLVISRLQSLQKSRPYQEVCGAMAIHVT